MDQTLNTIRVYCENHLDSDVSQTIDQLREGKPNAICLVIRCCLFQNFRQANSYFQKKGYSFDNLSMRRFLETTFKISRNELNHNPGVTIEDILNPNCLVEKKLNFLLNFLNLCKQKNHEILFEMKGPRLRSHSLGSMPDGSVTSNNMFPSLTGPPPHPSSSFTKLQSLDDYLLSNNNNHSRNLTIDITQTTRSSDSNTVASKSLKQLHENNDASGNNNSRGDLSSPSKVIDHRSGEINEAAGIFNSKRGSTAALTPRSTYFANRPNGYLTPPSTSTFSSSSTLITSPKHDDDKMMITNRVSSSPRQYLMASSPTRSVLHSKSISSTTTTTKIPNPSTSSSLIEEFEQQQKPNIPDINLHQRTGSDVSINSLSPREKISRKTSDTNASAGARRLNLEDEMALMERMRLLEARVETELSQINDRFTRLENQMNEVMKLVISSFVTKS